MRISKSRRPDPSDPGPQHFRTPPPGRTKPSAGIPLLRGMKWRLAAAPGCGISTDGGTSTSGTTNATMAIPRGRRTPSAGSILRRRDRTSCVGWPPTTGGRKGNSPAGGRGSRPSSPRIPPLLEVRRSEPRRPRPRTVAEPGRPAGAGQPSLDVPQRLGRRQARRLDSRLGRARDRGHGGEADDQEEAVPRHAERDDVREVHGPDLVREDDSEGDADPDPEDRDQRDLEEEYGEDHPSGEADCAEGPNLRASLH